jgi:hypothetical protein
MDYLRLLAVLASTKNSTIFQDLALLLYLLLRVIVQKRIGSDE